MVNNDIKVGPQVASDGVITTQRGSRTGEACVSFAHAYYQEPANRGTIMETASPTTGVAPGTLPTTTPPMTLWNPPNSNVFLNIIKTSLGYVSGTLGSGYIMYGVVPAQTTVPSGGLELIPQNTKLGFPRGQGRTFQGSTLTTTPTILRAGVSTGAFLASTAVPPFNAVDMIDGAFCLPPGTCFTMQEVGAAGSTPIVVFGIAWEEIPI